MTAVTEAIALYEKWSSDGFSALPNSATRPVLEIFSTFFEVNIPLPVTVLLESLNNPRLSRFSGLAQEILTPIFEQHFKTDSVFTLMRCLELWGLSMTYLCMNNTNLAPVPSLSPSLLPFLAAFFRKIKNGPPALRWGTLSRNFGPRYCSPLVSAALEMVFLNTELEPTLSEYMDPHLSADVLQDLLQLFSHSPPQKTHRFFQRLLDEGYITQSALEEALLCIVSDQEAAYTVSGFPVGSVGADLWFCFKNAPTGQRAIVEKIGSATLRRLIETASFATKTCWINLLDFLWDSLQGPTDLISEAIKKLDIEKTVLLFQNLLEHVFQPRWRRRRSTQITALPVALGKLVSYYIAARECMAECAVMASQQASAHQYASPRLVLLSAETFLPLITLLSEQQMELSVFFSLHIGQLRQLVALKNPEWLEPNRKIKDYSLFFQLTPELVPLFPLLQFLESKDIEALSALRTPSYGLHRLSTQLLLYPDLRPGQVIIIAYFLQIFIKYKENFATINRLFITPLLARLAALASEGGDHSPSLMRQQKMNLLDTLLSNIGATLIEVGKEDQDRFVLFWRLADDQPLTFCGLADLRGELLSVEDLSSYLEVFLFRKLLFSINTLFETPASLEVIDHQRGVSVGATKTRRVLESIQQSLRVALENRQQASHTAPTPTVAAAPARVIVPPDLQVERRRSVSLFGASGVPPDEALSGNDTVDAAIGDLAL